MTSMTVGSNSVGSTRTNLIKDLVKSHKDWQLKHSGHEGEAEQVPHTLGLARGLLRQCSQLCEAFDLEDISIPSTTIKRCFNSSSRIPRWRDLANILGQVIEK